MNNFLLGAFSPRPNENFNFIDELGGNSSEIFSQESGCEVSYKLFYHRRSNQKIMTKNINGLFILCWGEGLLIDKVYEFYISGGIKKIKAIPGLCSIVIIDVKNNKIVLLNDSFGTMPIYYHFHDEVIVFSSRLKGNLLYPNLKVELNQLVLFELFYSGVVCPPDTLIKDVYVLSTGEVIEFNGSLVQKTIWATPENKPEAPDTKNMLSLLLTSMERCIENSDEIGVMCSGGLDSSLLVALLKQVTSKKIHLYTLITHENKVETSAVEYLSKTFNVKTHYFNAKSSHFLDHVQESIRRGESEAVGALSLNIAVETAFAKFIHSSLMLTGDAMGPNSSLLKQSPEFYAHNYGILDRASTRLLLDNKPHSEMHYIEKTKTIITAKNKHLSFKKFRLDVRASLIGALNGKIRTLNSDQAYRFPFVDSQFMDYMESLNYYLPNKADYRNLLKQMILEHQLLPEKILNKPKAWMPGVMSQLDTEGVLDELVYQVSATNSHCSSLFNIETLSLLFSTIGQKQKYKLIMALYYLELFYEHFVKQRHSLKNELSCG